MARGDAENGVPAMEMTKWFDTNYHYIVPELAPNTTFAKTGSGLLRDVEAARSLGLSAKPVLVGPITFLLLAKETGGCDRWTLLPALVDALLRHPPGAGRALRLDPAGRACPVHRPPGRGETRP